MLEFHNETRLLLHNLEAYRSLESTQKLFAGAHGHPKEFYTFGYQLLLWEGLSDSTKSWSITNWNWSLVDVCGLN